MSTLPRLLLISLLSLGACAIEDASAPSDEREDVREVITYHRPEAPTAIDFESAADSSTTSHSISFGHCDEGEIGDDGAINIDCDQKWSELSWLSISKEDSQLLMDQGQNGLSFDLAVTESTADQDSVRFSIHAVAEDGSTSKLLSKGNVFDGERLELELQATEYHIFMARGENSSLIWHNGSLEVDLRATSN